MVGDIINALKDHASADHKRLCEGRNYACTCGFNADTNALVASAADEIVRLRSQIKTLEMNLRHPD